MHSPAPFTVHRDASNVSIRDAEGTTIAYDLPRLGDAHLFAAAPDLLALAEYVKAHPNAGAGLGDRPHAEWCEMQRLAEAAIARAKGGGA
jgi:hypothetical protein